MIPLVLVHSVNQVHVGRVLSHWRQREWTAQLRSLTYRFIETSQARRVSDQNLSNCAIGQEGSAKPDSRIVQAFTRSESIRNTLPDAGAHLYCVLVSDTMRLHLGRAVRLAIRHLIGH